MRIQETDRILKESRYGRHPVNGHDHKNVLSRTWERLTQLFRRQ